MTGENQSKANQEPDTDIVGWSDFLTSVPPGEKCFG